MRGQEFITLLGESEAECGVNGEAGPGFRSDVLRQGCGTQTACSKSIPLGVYRAMIVQP